MRVIAGLVTGLVLLGAPAVWAGQKEAEAKYFPQIEAWEKEGVLDAEPQKLVALFDTVLAKGDQASCRELGMALTERDHLRAAAYLAISHCPPTDQGISKEPIKRTAEEIAGADS